MISLTDDEKQLMVIIQKAINADLAASRENIQAIADAKLGRYKLDLTDAYISLIDKGFIESSNSIYSVTPVGEPYLRAVQKERPVCYYWYNEYYLRAEKSKAHGEFCERVYGGNYCQHGMADMAQADKLLDLLDLDEKDNVLELGCGNGLITEYMADKTGAHFTGVDIADEAIAAAVRRTEDKRERLVFDVRNMHDLGYPEKSFDTIIAIDTLYFVLDLDDLIGELKRITRAGGQMGFCYGTRILGSETTGSSYPGKNILGQALKKYQLEFAALDITEDDYRHWELKEKVLKELKPQFEAENNMFLYDNRIAECESLPRGEPGRRYLYHVRVN